MENCHQFRMAIVEGRYADVVTASAGSNSPHALGTVAKSWTAEDRLSHSIFRTTTGIFQLTTTVFSLDGPLDADYCPQT